MSARMVVALAFLGLVPVAGGQENGNKMYWTDYKANKILRADRDGSNVEELVDTGSIDPGGIALDLIEGKMYWVGATSRYAGKIQRANLDGSEVEDVLTDLGEIVGIALDPLNARVYWSRGDVWSDGIYRANMDGSNVEKLLWATGTLGIALDLAGDKMYWTDFGRNSIFRGSLEASDIENLVTSGLDGPAEIDLDLGERKMYWCDARTTKIQRADLDGSNVEDLITTGLVWPVGIALDPRAGKMYWTDADAGKIQRANLDGSDVEDLVTSGLQYAYGIALDVPTFPRVGIPVVSAWGMGVIACLLVGAGALIIRRRDRGNKEMVRVSHPRKPRGRRHYIALMGICAAGGSLGVAASGVFLDEQPSSRYAGR